MQSVKGRRGFHQQSCCQGYIRGSGSTCVCWASVAARLGSHARCLLRPPQCIQLVNSVNSLMRFTLTCVRPRIPSIPDKSCFKIACREAPCRPVLACNVQCRPPPLKFYSSNLRVSLWRHPNWSALCLYGDGQHHTGASRSTCFRPACARPEDYRSAITTQRKPNKALATACTERSPIALTPFDTLISCAPACRLAFNP